MLNNRLSDKYHRMALLLVCLVLCLKLSGCNDEMAGVLNDDQAEIEAKYVLKDASYLKNDPNINTVVPEIYSNPPKILPTSEGVKLFYFAHNKAPKVLAGLIKAQMKIETITESVGTNQLIMNCKDEAEAKEVLAYIEKIDVPPIQIKIDCIVIENYADFTMDRETKVKIEEIFGNEILTGPANGWGFFPGASLREEKRGTYGMSIGYDSDDVKLLVDMLVSRGYLKVMMNPVVRTVANKPASIVSRDRVPITKIVTGRDVTPYNMTEYTWVEDSLTVTPSVYADGSIGLSTKIKFGSKNTPEGVVQLRIITERSVELEETRVPVGNSLIIGGFKKSEKYSVIRGLPILKDLPLIGFLFSSKDYEERAKNITFILTPSISSEGIEFNKMVDIINELHKDHDSVSGLSSILSDPFGKDSYTKEIEHQAAAETIDRMKAEVAAAETEKEAQQAQQRLTEFEAKLKAGSEAKAKAQAVEQEYAEKLKNTEQAKQKLEEAQKLQTEESTAKIAEAKAAYDKSLEEAAAAKKQVDEAKAQVEQHGKMIEQATVEMNKLLEEKQQMEAEKLKLEQMKKETQEAVERAKAAEAEAARLAAIAEAQKKAAEQIVNTAVENDPFADLNLETDESSQPR